MDKQTDIYRYENKQIDRQINRLINIQTDRQKQTDWKDRQTNKKDRYIMYKQIDKQIDRQKDSHTDT